MTTTNSPYVTSIQLPDPDQIRALIVTVDERARLLRRLLRLAMRLQVNLTTGDRIATPTRQGVDRG